MKCGVTSFLPTTLAAGKDLLANTAEMIGSGLESGRLRADNSYASYVPAKSVRIEDKCGSIATGHDADFIALSPEVNVLETWINGVSVYRK